MTSLISIIVPCYNSAQTIDVCLNSLINQTYQQKEIICVDDGSTDETVRIISEYSVKHPYIKLIINETNKGPAISRNEALMIAQGKYVAFCDSDDWYDACFLEKMHDNMTRYQSDLTMCNYTKHVVSNNKVINVDYLPRRQEFYDLNEAIALSKASLCLLLCDKSLFNGLYIPDLRNGEDMAIVPCIEARANKISFTRDFLYHYRISNLSSSNKINNSIYRSLLSSFQFVETHFGDENQTAKEFIGIKIVLYGASMNAIKANVEKETVIKIINEFEIKYPFWYKNKFIKKLSVAKRIFLFFLKKRSFFFCLILTKLHTRIST